MSGGQLFLRQNVQRTIYRARPVNGVLYAIMCCAFSALDFASNAKKCRDILSMYATGGL